MMKNFPTRKEAIEKLQGLVDDQLDSKEVGLWASEIMLPENEALLARLQREDPVLEEFLTGTLGLAAETNFDGSPLYSQEDYQVWLDEFIAETTVDVKKYEQNYNVRVVKEKLDDISTFVSLFDKVDNTLPAIDIHFVKNRIYAVKFMNNDFFEVEDPVLFRVIDCLLAGKYQAKKRFLGKWYVSVVDKDDTIIPERIYSDAEFKQTYQTLPKSFTRRNEYEPKT